LTAQVAPQATSRADAVYRKVTLRLLPLLGLCYLTAYLDRVNVGFAKLQMAQDLGLSDAAYGLGAGIFFLGYFLLEVPSNLALHRVGARTWLARIMLTWAVVSAAMAGLAPLRALFGPAVAGWAFILLRFLLGAAEAGFFPGVLFYLTYWYPPSRRSLAVGQFVLAQPVAFILGAPLSGMILAWCEGAAGIRGWQWMFILEAAPAAILGFVLLARLDDGLADARWLTAAERQLLRSAIDSEASPSSRVDLKSLAGDAAIWALALAYFLLVLGAYGLNLWLPSIVKAAGVTRDLTVGFVTAIPYVIGAAVMLTAASRTRSAGAARSRAAWMCGLAGLGLALSARIDGSPVLMMAGVSLAVAGYLSANVLFWRLPSEALAARALAAGLAMVNAVGNLGGFLGPYLMGALADQGRGPRAGLLVLAAALASAGLVLAATRPAIGARQPPATTGEA